MSEKNEVVENLAETIKKNLNWLPDMVYVGKHRWSIKLLANCLYKHRKKIGLYTKNDIKINTNEIKKRLLEIYNNGTGCSASDISKEINIMIKDKFKGIKKP